jgi:hypothetical protein
MAVYVILVAKHLMIRIRSGMSRLGSPAATVYWCAESIRLRTLWWLQDGIVLPIARLSAARWTAGRPVPGWWRALLVFLLTRVED